MCIRDSVGGGVTTATVAEGASVATGAVAGAVAARLAVGGAEGAELAEAVDEGVVEAPGDFFTTKVYVPIPIATMAKNAPIPMIMPELDRCDGTPATDEASWRSSPPDWLPFWGMKPPAPGQIISVEAAPRQ